LGFFADSSFSAHLVELQPAERGRKFASKDRRPLDPPPIVQLQIFRTIVDPSTGASTKEEIIDYGLHNILGCMCSVELYRVTPESTPSITDTDSMAPISGFLHSRGELGVPEEHVLASTATVVSQERLTYSGVEVSTSGIYTPHPAGDAPSDSAFTGTLSASLSAVVLSDGTSGEQKCSEELFGTNVVQVRPVNHDGRSILLFVFGDIAVRAEGWFSLRYRFFDIFSTTREGQSTSILAECKGKQFRVYASKEFPGLKASTELTLLAVRHGISVHVRQKERKRRRRSSVDEEEDDE